MLSIDTIKECEREIKSNINTIEHYKLYHEEISKIAKQYLDKYAIVFNETKITYEELDKMTNSLAYYLRKQNVNRNDIIPIISNRSPYYIIGSIGISKAGGAYLPVDPKLPEDRIKLMLKKCQSKLVLYSNTENIVEKLNKTEFICYNLKNHDYSKNIEKIDNINESTDLCYVLFTSGSTGEPKGTLINHFNLFNFVRSYNEKENSNEYCMYDVFAENGVQNILSISNFSFCTSNVDNIVSLVHGLKVVLADDIVSNDILLLSKYIINNDIDLIVITPTRLSIFLENDVFRNSLSQLKVICLVGEKLSYDLCKQIRKYSDCNIYNAYGLTECTAVCSCKKIIMNNDDYEQKENKITIGRPLTSCKMYILDQEMKSVPVGVEGEIYIGGYSVGDGYLNNEKLTKEKYIENPFKSKKDIQNQVIHKTGDHGRWTEDGEIEYLGRKDFQVKIHGQRIELGEIESKIREIDGINQCVVVDKIKKETGIKYLMCYYTLMKEQSKFDSDDIRNYLKQKLPPYMIPNFYKQIDEIPLSIHDKLDRQSLPEPEFLLKDLIKESYIAPQTQVEKTLCVLYSKIFNIPVENIGVMSVFHELGGDSLMAIKILTQINKIFNIKLGVKDIMEHSSIRSLTACVEQKICSKSDKINQMGCIQKYNKDEYPITPILSSFPYKIENDRLVLAFSFNMLVFYQLSKFTNIEKLIQSFNKILDRHDVLKTKFMVNQQNKVAGKILKDEKLKVEYYTKDNFEKFVRPFNLTKDKLLIRVGIIQNPDDIILMMDMDHRIGDGISYGILIKELLMTYNDIPLNELPIQYSDYAIDYDKRVHSIGLPDIIKFYQNEVFSEPYQSLTLPKKENYELKTKAIESIFVLTDEKTYHTINHVTEKYKLTKTAFFLTVYSFIISVYSEGESKNIFTTLLVSNRMMPDTEKLIGLFLRCIPILVKIKKNGCLIDLIRECMDTILKAYDCDIPYTMISEALNLPICNSVLQFDPYDLKRNENQQQSEPQQNQQQQQQLPKLLNLLEMFKKYGKESVLFQLLNSNNVLHPDFKWTIGEEKDYYSILFKYNKNLYGESLIKEIVNKFLYILSDETNFLKNTEELINEIKSTKN